MLAQRLAMMPVLAACLWANSSVHAALIAEDVFTAGGSGNYTAGSNLNGQNPTSTTGFADAWTGTTTNAYQPGSTNLTMAGVANSGGSLINNYGAYNGTRSISRPLSAYTGSDTLWFSSLVQFNQAMLSSSGVSGSSSFVGFLSGALPTTSSGGSAAALWSTSNGGSLNGFAWGISKGQLAVRYQSGSSAVTEATFTPGFSIAADTTYLLIAKLIVNSSGNDTLNLWFLPSAPANEGALGTPTLTISAADLIDSNTDISRLAAFSAAPYDSSFGIVPAATTWDAIRMGTEFTDLSVSAVPEPAAAGLLGLGGLLMLACKRD